jgi:hypothetical protein
LKKLDIGQMVGILANVGVLLGILLLVFELAQSREMMEAQTRHDLSQSLVEQLIPLALDAELAELSLRIARNCPTGDCVDVEQYRFELLWSARFRYWEDAYYQYQLGLYDEQEFSGQLETWKTVISANPGVRDHWRGVRAGYSPDFAAEFNALLPESER